jgi:hypothetical protein
MLMQLKQRAMTSGQPIHLIHPVTKQPMEISPQRKLTPDEASCFNHFANQKPIVGAKMADESAGFREFKNVRDKDNNKILDKSDKKERVVDFTDAINARIENQMKVFDKRTAEKMEKAAGIDPDKPRSRIGLD